MGIYRQATTAIGYEFSISNFFEETTEPNCPHNPPAGAKHCPECGRPVGTRKTTRASDEWWNFNDEFRNNLPNGYVIDSLYDDAGNKMWIGYGSTVSDEEVVMVPAKSYEQIKLDIAEIMEYFVNLGLVELDDKNFGIWTLFTGH